MNMPKCETPKCKSTKYRKITKWAQDIEADEEFYQCMSCGQHYNPEDIEDMQYRQGMT